MKGILKAQLSGTKYVFASKISFFLITSHKLNLQSK